MAPRRGGGVSFGDSGSSEYTVSACSQSGWWGLSTTITSAIFLAVYLGISIWHLVFMVKSRQVKGVPMLLRFRFAACLFCFFLSSLLESIYRGAHECGNMTLSDYMTGMIPVRIFLHLAWLFLIFVVLFPMSRAIRVTRRMLIPQPGENKSKQHKNKNIERAIQGIFLSLMIIAITIHMFIHALNQTEARDSLGDFHRYQRRPGEEESYAAFPFLQLFSNVILLGVSRSRMAGLVHVTDLRLQRIKSRYNTFMIILLLRSIFIIIDTIVFDLADTQSAIGVYLVLLIQKCFDALLLVYIVLLTKSVRTLGDPRAA
ncbi:hypothetical protein ASPCAL14800 [Aspergillus calidoustus]|uniref:Uncharacterized protein n=1 Tax=Aspergillus calidoustus TaxID=454130 RepID=A0A0U4ZQS5_ASPCI|nr:hypothetical protein ASPCAL14800 [Aspergillus calidoustus]